MKFHKTVLGLAMALTMTSSWGHGEHGSNTVWTTTDGHNIVTSNEECVRAFDFASLGRASCHAPEVALAPAIVVPVVAEIIEEVEPTAGMVMPIVETQETFIYFDTDSSALSTAAKLALHEAIYTSKTADKVLAVQVVGHADTRGDADDNLNLSQRRVNAVIEHLKASGMNTSSSFAQGEARPVLDDGTENLAASRRAQLLIKVQLKAN